MRILAIETSCDETAIAIVNFTDTKAKPNLKIETNLVSSQVKLHAKYGGVVPNLAKREHQLNLPMLLIKALQKSGLSKTSRKTVPVSKSKLDLKDIFAHEPELLAKFEKEIIKIPAPDIDTIAVTIGPGLAPALWVGINFAKALAILWDKPLIPVNHMEGHFYSAFLNEQKVLKKIKRPCLALLVSGGHTELVLSKKNGSYQIVGETMDDAAGEAFDKVARILDLGYPGGPALSKLAKKGNLEKYILPQPMINSKDYNFSFSGLKTAVLYLMRDNPKANKKDIAASFEKAAVGVLVKKTLRAVREFKVKNVILAGGVSANNKLRESLAYSASELGVTCHISPENLTGDNALMIALAAYFSGKKKAPKLVGAEANLRLS